MRVVLPDAHGGDALPRAGGRVISEAAADQAAEWLTLFMSGMVSEEERLLWQAWRMNHPDNELAWQHIEAVTARFKGLHGAAAYSSLMTANKKKQDGRRKMLAILLGIGAVAATGVAGTGAQPLRQLMADFSTGVGEQREWILDDGTRLFLNTASAVNMRFDQRERLLTLISGEIRVQTGHVGRAGRAPLFVQTSEGRIRALGTIFAVRQRSGLTEVTVQESAVEIAPSRSQHAVRVLMAGQQASFSDTTIAIPTAVAEENVAWLKGHIVANEIRLRDFLTELSRYRSGVVRCDPAVADLRFSGVFPLNDVEGILALLPNSLPVRIKPRSRYWIMVEADPERT